MSYAEIAVPSRVFHGFTYEVPAHLSLTPGMRVVVPFRNKPRIGVVLKTHDELSEDVQSKNIRAIESLAQDQFDIPPTVLSLLEWMSGYYHAPIGELVKIALPKKLLQPEKHTPRTPRDPFANILRSKKESGLTLTDEQQRAMRCCLNAFESETSQPVLLHGITGSGKTELYIRLFQHALSEGKQCLFLVPEIGLTPQLAGKILSHFGDDVAIYHSKLTDAQRLHQWKRMQRGEARIVVGTRSALFAPFSNLGVIIIDEEHDSSYKQDEGILYHARDAAVMRASMENCPIILGSATPSLESFSNATLKKYSYVKLTKRATGIDMPTTVIIDKKKHLSKQKDDLELQALTPQLLDAMKETFERGEQTLLFLNRRGFAHYLLCESCGHVPQCPNCSISLTYHHKKRHIRCHYCEYATPVMHECGECGEDMIPMGEGTERLEAEIKDFLPTARVARLDRDTISKKGVLESTIADMHDHNIDILIGTQLITKGHDMANVTLVGIISADAALNLPDFRAAERTFQLVAQVAGRAGRAKKTGRVLIQTYCPEHHSITAASNHDYEAFWSEEYQHRKEVGYPPFSKLANIRLSSSRESEVRNAALQIKKYLERELGKESEVELLGPAPSPLEKVRNSYRWQILVKAPSAAHIQHLFSHQHHLIQKMCPRTVRMNVDIDPINLL